MTNQKNVLGEALVICGCEPMTGFYRNGRCETGPDDRGLHFVCAIMDEDFLRFSKSVGNDLSTALPEYGFAGLKEGDHWCLCVTRWKEAFDLGFAPKVLLQSTHQSALEFVDLADLQSYAG